MKQDILFTKLLLALQESHAQLASLYPFLCALATTLINVYIIGTVLCSLYRANGHIVEVTTEAGSAPPCTNNGREYDNSMIDGQTGSLTLPSRLKCAQLGRLYNYMCSCSV